MQRLKSGEIDFISEWQARANERLYRKKEKKKKKKRQSTCARNNEVSRTGPRQVDKKKPATTYGLLAKPEANL